MYKEFRNTVEKIIESYTGKEASDFLRNDNSLKIKKDSFLDFRISKEGDFLYIGFYSECNGDLLSDPIFVFKVKEDIWYPVALEQIFGYTKIGLLDEQDKYQYYPSRFKSVKSFAVSCAREWKDYYIKEKEYCTGAI